MNQKIIRVMQAHELVVQDSLECLGGSKLGISYEFIKRRQLDVHELKKGLDEHNIRAVVVYSGPLNMSTGGELEVVLGD